VAARWVVNEMKGVTDVGGLRDIRSMHSTGRRSIPKAQSSSYLDLYMLQKERERLEKERSLLEKRRQGIERRLKEIQEQIGVLEKSAQEGGGGGVERVFKKGASERKWKTMALTY